MYCNEWFVYDDWRRCGLCLNKNQASQQAKPPRARHEYGVLFAVGLPRSRRVQRKLLLESQLYGDIIQADFEDVYFNLTTKVLSALRLVFCYCPQTKAIIKIDDDAAWNIVRTKHLVQRHLDHNEIYGQMVVTKEEWGRNDYPPFCRGMAYVIPRRAAEKMLSVVPLQQFLKVSLFIT
ncbi:N-acetyllactosaminide 3-alpha-galactosyltransferase [Cooperia oncophora]